MAVRNPFKHKKILLGLSGSIAIYKSCDLVRRLKDQEADVVCLMSSGAQKFIAPLTFSALSGNPVATDIWDSQNWEMAHIRLAEQAKLFIIAPASADCLAHLAAGMACDILSAAILTVKIPVLIAPAMHHEMWTNPATESNIKRLKSFGYHFVGPEYGNLLGRKGWGRMSDVQKIISAATQLI